ncbi:DNA topoisomerase [Lachnospiraceae bacterium oral taxon 096]|nr:DNA topoisomerase [Lachnospiraceae bacterium oral taxon 096]QUI95297.1 DNA topoisomerase 4 subunit A [Lachnospiraceae bacterium oral taxon 096]
MAEKILRTEYSEEMQKSYLDYSMSVITSRAIPDARDGLKPVQRRVLYDMSELHINADKPHRKSARIVGDTMGKYHPHGDSSIYETLVVLTQDWKKGMPLIDGHGNFGSIEGDGAAAMRYTEAKLTKFTQEVFLKDLDKTVDFVANYDETEKEPAVLPVRIPNLLLNGAEGIAVGMSTSMPPHNLAEICDVCIAYIRNRLISVEELMHIMPGPDFPTGGIVANRSDLLDIYRTGTGKIKLRGKIEIELGRRKSDKDRLIVTEIPYTMIGAGLNKFLQDVADLVESKKLPEVVDISNQSDKNGTRIVLELRKDADIDRVKNMLYKKTKLEDSFGVNMLAIAQGRPETLNLLSILQNFLDFQYENATKKYNILLEKEIEKKEIQEGLIRACDCIDQIIAILRKSKNISLARERLMAELEFTQRQAQAILEMKLYKLIGLEVEALLKENRQTLKNIKNYTKLLQSQKSMDEVLIADLLEIKEKFGRQRRTSLEDAKEAVVVELPKVAQKIVFVMDRFGYAKTMDFGLFEKNRETVESEYKYVVPMMSDDKVCIFTDLGLLHQVKAENILSGKLRDKGIPLDNLCKLDTSKEEIRLIASFAQVSDEEKRLLFVTEWGLIKQIDGKELSTNNRQVVATKLGEGDKVLSVRLVSTDSGYEEVILVSDGGYIVKFPLIAVNLYKKTSKGEKAMRLLEGEKLVAMYLLSDGDIVKIHGKPVNLLKLKLSNRNDRGTKLKG